MGEEILTFGAFFKQRRLAMGKTLREFCRENGLDPGNISRIERDKTPPPQNRLEDYARYLKLKKDEWEEFKELAAVSAHRIPDYITDQETLARLPIFFRAMRDSEVSEEGLKELIEKIKES